MFVVDYGMVRRQKPRRRYWWGAMGFAIGAGLGVAAAHLVAAVELGSVANAALGVFDPLSAKAEAGRAGGS